MLLSRACEYAMLAVWYLARHPDHAYVSVREIAEQNEISSHFLSKVLGTLTQKGIMVSLKGPKGGVALARPAEDIRVVEVVEAIDGLEFRRKCLTGLPKCDDENPCPLHDDWKRIREEIFRVFADRTIAELTEQQVDPRE